jgi:hypothetical protein
MVGIVIIWAQHSAKIRAKSLIVLQKTIPIIAHLCSEMAVFGRKSVRFFQRSIWYSTTKHAVHSYLRNRTTAQTEYVVMGCTVNNLSEFWVYKLTFLKRHPSVQKDKIIKQRALITVIKEILLPLIQPRLFEWSNTRRRVDKITD